MTSSFNGVIHEVTVANGASTTRWIDANIEYADATQIHIQSPAAMDAGTWTIETSQDASTAATLSNGTADIGPPGAGKSRSYTEMLGSKYFRIKTSVAVGSLHTFRVSKQFTN